MGSNRIKHVHQREQLRLKTQITQSRIAIADHKDKIATNRTKLDQLKPPKAPTDS